MAKFTKKKKIALTGVALVLGTGGAAFAYWTAGGSGEGEATTGTTTPLTAVQTSTVTALRPGDSAQTLSGNFDNPNSGPVYVATVTASISSVTKAPGAPAGTCDATDYTLGSPIMTVGREVDAGTGVDAWTGATLSFHNKPTAQDACKGATVTLSYTIA